MSLLLSLQTPPAAVPYIPDQTGLPVFARGLSAAIQAGSSFAPPFQLVPVSGLVDAVPLRRASTAYDSFFGAPYQPTPAVTPTPQLELPIVLGRRVLTHGGVFEPAARPQLDGQAIFPDWLPRARGLLLEGATAPFQQPAPQAPSFERAAYPDFIVRPRVQQLVYGEAPEHLAPPPPRPGVFPDQVRRAPALVSGTISTDTLALSRFGLDAIPWESTFPDLVRGRTPLPVDELTSIAYTPALSRFGLDGLTASAVFPDRCVTRAQVLAQDLYAPYIAPVPPPVTTVDSVYPAHFPRDSMPLDSRGETLEPPRAPVWTDEE